MKTKCNFPTPDLDVNEVLHLLFDNVKAILQDQFVGMYLFGSLANGDFDTFSDIDVLIVTEAEIPQDLFSTLSTMHEQIAEYDSPWAAQLEVSYIPQTALRRYDPANSLHPHLDRGSGEKLHRMTHASDWIVQRHMLRERGILVSGLKLNTLIDPVSPDDLRQAVADVLPLWIKPILDDPSQIHKRGYQSFFVLSLCRMLYTMKHGRIVSKKLAAEWAKENLDSKWKPLIERALIGRQNPNLDAEPQDIQGTLDMMRYTRDVILNDHKERRSSNVTNETPGRNTTQSDMDINRPTPYPDVNDVLNVLLKSVKEILDDQFTGMYLYGSLSSGDFNPDTSDIDFLVVTADPLSEETISRLDTMHQQTWASSLKRAGKLEGAYVPRVLIRRHAADGAPCPTVNEGRFYVASLGSDWIIQRHIIRETGVALEGPDPKTLIDFVSPDDIRGAVMGTLYEWWFPMLDDPSWLRDKGPGVRAFAVITMCRVLHALEYGTIVSKPCAIQWAQTRVDAPWRQLIDKAVAVSRHEDLDVSLDETLDFIRFTRERVLKS